MELNLIPGDRAFTAAKTPAADFQLPTVLDIDAVARPVDSAQARERKKAAGAEEPEAEEQRPEGEAAESSGEDPESSINLFA